MSATALLRGCHSLTNLASTQSRAASLTSAIGRGIRRSKGVGFRGREGASSADGRNSVSQPERTGSIRRTAEPKLGFAPRMTRDGWKGKEPSARIFRGKKELRNDEDPPPRRSRASRFNDPNSSFGKRSTQWTDGNPRDSRRTSPRGRRGGRGRTSLDRLRGASSGTLGSSRPLRTLGTSRFPDGKIAGHSDVSRDLRTINAGFRYESQRPERFTARRGESRREDQFDNIQAKYTNFNPHQRDASTRPDSSSRQGLGGDGFMEAASSRGSKVDYHGGRERKADYENGRRPNMNYDVGREGKADYGNARTLNADYDVDRGPKSVGFSKAVDKRIPLSIPYTTPASEFLYGTSVVESALLSHRNPKRKLYKIYIYAGENRDNVERDAGIERLARKNGVQVVKVDANGLRVMDKMSGGRPHNGYILEASPLPRLPITSLGEIKENGFSVTLDHQSREEAAVNGTSDFIPIPRNKLDRNPFILFLDSILDPGNLGGIIRTASFLGVTAIAIANRNSAPFTPVVLKASAGASENITLFSVSKPAGFITDSKFAGWTIYAAVAPGKRDPNMAPLVTTDDLKSPLQQGPCVLMLGSEGEGLRWNLRSKADIELAIQGSGQSLGVDSLNVSVAAGILCSAFLRNPNSVAQRESSRDKRDLF